jgi:hypothetical protein
MKDIIGYHNKHLTGKISNYTAFFEKCGYLLSAMYLSPSHYQKACDSRLLSYCWDEFIFRNSPLFFTHTVFQSMLKNIGILDMFEIRRRLIYQNIFDFHPKTGEV